MKQNKLYLRLIILLIIGIVIYAMTGLVRQRPKEKPYTCSVILDNSSSDRWISLKKGLEQAAGECNVKLNILSTGKLSGAEEEQLARREIKNGADGIIAPYTDHDASVSQTEDIFSNVMPDWQQIGTSLADSVPESIHADGSPVKIGVVSKNQHLLSVQETQAAFEKALEGKNAEILWILRECTSEQLSKQMSESPADIIASFDNDNTELAVDLKSSAAASFLLCGAGCSEKLVFHLDQGSIKTLIVPNDFLLGYQSVKQIVNQIETHSPGGEPDRISSFIVNKDNLYDEKLQRILFPMIQ